MWVEYHGMMHHEWMDVWKLEMRMDVDIECRFTITDASP
jgi:hypothetical protein